MSEMTTALLWHGRHRVQITQKPTHHSHRSQELSMSRPGRRGTFALLPGASRPALIWRSTRLA